MGPSVGETASEQMNLLLRRTAPLLRQNPSGETRWLSPVRSSNPSPRAQIPSWQRALRRTYNRQSPLSVECHPCLQEKAYKRRLTREGLQEKAYKRRLTREADRRG